MIREWRRRKRLNRLYTRARAAFVEADEVRSSGKSKRSLEELAEDLDQLLAEALESIDELPEVAPVLIDVARASLWLAVPSRSWGRVLGLGTCLALAATSIRQGADDLDISLERQIGSLIGAHLDVALYGAVKAGLPSFVGTLSDMVLGGGFFSRQMVQMAEDEVLEAWDWGSGLALNGAFAGDPEVTARVLEGSGWLSERQRVTRSPDEIVAVTTGWVERHAALLQTLPLRTTTGLSSEADPHEAEWKLVLEEVDHVLALPKTEQFGPAMALMCLAPIAAEASGRDIIYLVASPFGGAAVRFFGGTRYRTPPQVADLPAADLQSLRRMRWSIATANSIRPIDVSGRAAALDAVRMEVGGSIVAPLLNRWTDLEKLALIPVGEMQDLPLSSALVGTTRWADGVDVTLAPNAASLFVASTPRGTHPTDPVVVMGDPAQGDIHLPWIEPEVQEVARVYGRSPDLLVDYPPSPTPTSLPVREVRSPVSLPIGTPEHVLSRLENASVVHLACHGLVPSGTGSPELLLNGRVPFDALQLHRLAQGACVVLSACSVGRSIDEAPLAVLGFPAMLLASGAAAVIASSLPLLDCRETVDFMVELHRNLSQGFTPAAALTAATARSKAEGVPSSVWGGFEVFGT